MKRFKIQHAGEHADQLHHPFRRQLIFRIGRRNLCHVIEGGLDLLHAVLDIGVVERGAPFVELIHRGVKRDGTGIGRSGERGRTGKTARGAGNQKPSHSHPPVLVNYRELCPYNISLSEVCKRELEKLSKFQPHRRKTDSGFDRFRAVDRESEMAVSFDGTWSGEHRQFREFRARFADQRHGPGQQPPADAAALEFRIDEEHRNV